MLKTAPSLAAVKIEPATDVPAASQVTLEIGVLLAIHLAIAVVATVVVQSFAVF
jgi:hypothetical protein